MRGEVHVWWLELDRLDRATRASLHAQLDDAERERWARFRFERDRAIYSASHGLLRRCLSWFVGATGQGAVPPEAWRFAVEPGGKPYLAGDRAVHFNLTHTKGLAAAAVSAVAELGIDAELLERLDSVLALAHHYFSPAEVRALRRLADPGAQQALFLRLWTLKEAYIKARGTGLGTPLDRFGFDLARSIRFFADADLDPDPDRWCFRQWRATARHVVAAAAPRVVTGPDAGAPRFVVHADELPGP